LPTRYTNWWWNVNELKCSRRACSFCISDCY
jgi:hypothetical protein